MKLRGKNHIDQDKDLHRATENRSSFLRRHWGKLLFLTLLSVKTCSSEIGIRPINHQGALVENKDSSSKLQGLDSLYDTQHEETNKIVKVLTGFASPYDLAKFQERYQQDTAFVNLVESIKPDTILYDCIVAFQYHYQHPYLSFGGDYRKDMIGDQLGYEEGDSKARVAAFSYLIQLRDIKGKGTFEEDLSDSAKAKNIQPHYGKQLLLNLYFEELAHLQQVKQIGGIQFAVDYTKDYFKTFFKQDSMYHREGMIEYMAHNEEFGRIHGLAGLLEQTFITLYEEKADKNNAEHMEQLAVFYDRYFRKYSDPIRADYYRKRAVTLRKKRK